MAGTAVAPVVNAARPAASPPWTAVATDSTLLSAHKAASASLSERAARAMTIAG